MDKKALEKDYSSDDEESKSLIQKIYSIIRENWVAFAFALGIALITIIVVPIVYSIGGSTTEGVNSDLAWNVKGITIANQTNIIYGTTNNSFGLIISSLKYYSNNLYIVDKNNHRILKYPIYDDNSYSGVQFTLVAGHLNGSNGSDQNSFNSPNDIYVKDENTIFVADSMNHRIQLWNVSLNTGSTICGNGTMGSSTTQLNQPMALTMDDNYIIYVADYGNNRIVSCNQTNPMITVIIPYNSNGDRSTYVYTPISIQYDSYTNSLVIAQQMGYNVIRWSLNSTTTNSWTLIAGSASSELSGTSRTLFNEVCYTDIDQFGHTYVVDCYNQRIQYYLGDLIQGRTIAGVIQASGNNTYLFNYPTTLTYDSKMNLYVADSNNYRIQKFIIV